MTDTGAFDWQVEDETGGKVVRAERQGKEPTLVRAGPVLRARSRWTSTSWPRLAAVVGAPGAGGDQPRQQLGRLQKSLDLVGCVGHAMAMKLTVSYCLRQERPPAPATGGCSWISSGHVSCAQPEPENDYSFGACVVMPGKHAGRSPTSLNFIRQEYNTSRQWESRRLSRHVLGCSSVELRHLEFKDFGIILSTTPRHCHSSRRREGGGDLTLVVRMFHARCDVLLSFVFLSVPFVFCRFHERRRQNS